MPKLRPATSTDWPAVEALLLANKLPQDGARQHLSAYLVAEEDGAVVGTAGIEVYGDLGLLRSVAVSPDKQNQGIGKHLFDGVLGVAHRQGLRALYLLTTTAADHFERLGFKRNPRDAAPSALQASDEFRGACPASATFMLRPLIKIRPATPDDAEAVTAIYAPVVATTSISFELTPPSVDDMRGRIVKTLQDLPWLVSEDPQGLVNGYAYASKHRERAAYQWSVDVTAYVREDSRRQDVGKRLYGRLFQSLVELGYFQAFAGIALPNAASIALHESVGFKPIGVYRNVGFKLGARHDVGWWQRQLREPTEPTEPKKAAGGLRASQ